MSSPLFHAAITDQRRTLGEWVEERGVDVNDQLYNFGRTALQIRALCWYVGFFLFLGQFFWVRLTAVPNQVKRVS